MSFARFGAAGSQVYVYADVYGGITCCSCLLIPLNEGETDAEDAGNARLFSWQETTMHFEEHRKNGHRVPASMLLKIMREDAAGTFDWERKK